MANDTDLFDELYEWLDGIALSRPKKNLSRDFSDAVLLAEVVKKFLPKNVDLHNYNPANSFTKKMENWDRLNKRVLSKLGLPQTNDKLVKYASCRKGEVEKLLISVKKKIVETMNPIKKVPSEKIVYTFEESNEQNTEYDEIPVNEFCKLREAMKSKSEEIISLKEKVNHLETLIDLKEQRITDLKSQLARCKCNPGFYFKAELPK